MSYSFFRRLVLPVLLTASLLVPSAASISSAAATPDAYHDDWLHVNDNAEIVDRDGNPVWITGCNWFGYNVGSQVFDGVWSQNMHDMLRQIADHGFNFCVSPCPLKFCCNGRTAIPIRQRRRSTSTPIRN